MSLVEYRKLRAEYEILTGEKCPHYLKKEEIVDKVNQKKKEAEIGIDWEEMSEEDRIEAAKKINSHTYTTLDEDELIPAFKDGEMYAILDGEYVPYADAEIEIEKRKLAKLQSKIKKLELNKKVMETKDS